LRINKREKNLSTPDQTLSVDAVPFSLIRSRMPIVTVISH